MAKWTLIQIADAIMNNVLDGLQGSPNSPIPKEQLKAEVILLRNSLIEATNDPKNGIAACVRAFSSAGQQINCIPVSQDGKLSDCCEETTGEDTLPVAMIPQALTLKGQPALSFVGDTARRTFGWKVYHGEDYKTHQYRMGLRGFPYVAIFPAKNGYHPLYIFDAPENLEKISITGAFVDPYKKYEYSCCSVPGDPQETEAFQASESIIKQIVDTLTEQYLSLYRGNNAPIQANDQTDKVS